MMIYKILKRRLIFFLTLISLFIFIETIFIKANAEGWVKVDNSWRYYSDTGVETGWYKSNGNWYFLNEYGAVKTGWLKSEGKYYYLDLNTGKMLTGWIEDKGKWYYLNSSGEMVTGWLKYKDNLYYLNNSGVMVRDIYIGEYYLGPNGTWENRN
ncbi:N-acetylmuramoyl-L-alanine amidase family protein [Clostridium sp. C2-6-12]|uniref:N-acetylmuramoyl-L-alanine amidase family protein n=1 Tax=Clostridium sp. C2-6-12 TaxID=2698832 RepID=UPI001FABD54C|nr:N-acetylmuramoyl-L-alanine amidase family protein [Clostridium sp. C2-6-12]